MPVAPHAGIVDFGTFTPSTLSKDGIQGEVPQPLSTEAGYVLSTDGWVPAGGVSTGVATLDFGSGNKTASVTVTGVAQVTASSKISVSMRILATLTHSVDDMLIDPIRLAVHSLVPSDGFSIYGEMPDGTGNGTYGVQWIVNK
jgi:hypothetical protein